MSFGSQGGKGFARTSNGTIWGCGQYGTSLVLRLFYITSYTASSVRIAHSFNGTTAKIFVDSSDNVHIFSFCTADINYGYPTRIYYNQYHPSSNTWETEQILGSTLSVPDQYSNCFDICQDGDTFHLVYGKIYTSAPNSYWYLYYRTITNGTPSAESNITPDYVTMGYEGYVPTPRDYQRAYNPRIVNSSGTIYVIWTLEDGTIESVSAISGEMKLVYAPISSNVGLGTIIKSTNFTGTPPIYPSFMPGSYFIVNTAVDSDGVVIFGLNYGAAGARVNYLVEDWSMTLSPANVWVEGTECYTGGDVLLYCSLGSELAQKNLGFKRRIDGVWQEVVDTGIIGALDSSDWMYYGLVLSSTPRDSSLEEAFFGLSNAQYRLYYYDFNLPVNIGTLGGAATTVGLNGSALFRMYIDLDFSYNINIEESSDITHVETDCGQLGQAFSSFAATTGILEPPTKIYGRLD